MNSRTAIFILGMHRSGTSALARVINLLGASLPKRVLPPGLGNELGHWEPEAAVALHDRVLQAAGTSVNGLNGPPDGWFDTPAARAFVAPMRELIETEFADTSVFVFKDPRSALLFPLWRRVLADLGVRCLPVVIVRHPVDAAASLVARQTKAVPWQTWTLDRAGLLWLRYTLAAERHTRGDVRAFCTYEDLLNDWQGVTRQLASTLGLSWPRLQAEAAADIDAFLDAGHRHHRAQQTPAIRGGIWSSWIAPAFEQLSHAGANAEPTPEVLDAIGQSFADVCSSILPPAEAGSVQTADAPAAIAVQGAAGRRSLCIVVADFMLEAAPLRQLSDMLEVLGQADSRITLVPFGTFPEAASQALAEFGAKHGLETARCNATELPIEPAFLKPTIELFRLLRSRAFEVVLFPDRGGPGYASIVAKAAGLALSNTTLGVLAYGPLRLQRERDRIFPCSLVTLSVEHIEQNAIDSADAVLPPSQADRILEIARNEGVKPARHAVDSRVADSITVVITHFERPQLLEQNLQALEAQGDRDFSVLVVDDGSRSAEAQAYLADLEARYSHLGLRLIRQANRYLGAARNAGIRAASTAFVILLDDDNLAFPAMVATLRQAVRATQADVVTCGVRHFHNASGRPDDAGAPAHGPEQFFAGGPMLVGAVHNCFGDASGIYRRAIFDHVGYFHEQYGVSYEDWQMHLRVVAAGLRLVSLPEVLVWYRVRADSMLRTTHRYDNASVIASVIRELPCSALEGLPEFLIGQEEERVRLNLNIEMIRAVSAVNEAVLSETDTDALRRTLALEQMLEARTKEARTAETYAQSLEAALSQAQASRETSEQYARSLESARAVAETYARNLEAELAQLREESARGHTQL